MLGKLLKYDLKALGRVLLPVQLGALVVGLMATFVLTATVRFAGDEYGYQGSTGADMLNSSIAGFSILAVFLLSIVLFSSYLVTLLLIARHFYTNLMGDEGYLSFTLPVSIHEHLLSKVISGFIWSIINMLVILISLGLLMVFGTAYSGLVNKDVLQILSEGMQWLFANDLGIVVIEYPILVVVGTIDGLLLVFASIVAGSLISAKHKVAAAVGAYFAANMVLYTINSMTQGALMGLMGMDPTFMFSAIEPSIREFLAFYQVTILISLAISILTIVATYAFSHYALSNRLNLE
ncbi:MAG: hypothetical protein GX562_00020 [Coriobacteriaceae bacterium]|nr:hypothetical protein [Coriobacteriaceae bacterium]